MAALQALSPLLVSLSLGCWEQVLGDSWGSCHPGQLGAQSSSPCRQCSFPKGNSLPGSLGTPSSPVL